MKYKWIAGSGICELKDIIPLLKNAVHFLKDKEEKKSWFIAMMTDSFTTGYYFRVKPEEIVKKQLLELRVFNEESEILFTRGSVGNSFQYRMTKDEGLDETDFIISKQFIDINGTMVNGISDNGNRTLISTVGGKYSLPITESQKRVQVKSYISYDENGMAKIADSRVCCFTE